MAYLKGRISANLNALLDTIAFAEGTSTSKVTRQDGYDVIVSGINGPEIMYTYADHPFATRAPKQVNNRGLYSSAAGRYQQMKKDWPHYKALLQLPDFSPESQDKLAIRHIREAGALELIEAGKFAEAINRIRNLWASLPGAGYGQKELDFKVLQGYYIKQGGAIWEPLPQSSPVSSQSSAPSLEPTTQENVKEKPNPTLPTEKQKPQGLLSLIIGLFKRK